jgi:hypothetical protein
MFLRKIKEGPNIFFFIGRKPNVFKILNHVCHLTATVTETVVCQMLHKTD